MWPQYQYPRSTKVAVAALILVPLCLSAQEPIPTEQQQSGWRKLGDVQNDERTARLSAPPPAAMPAAAPSQITIPAGTWITVRVNEPLSSDHNVVGDTFTATLGQPIVANGFVIARRGQTIAGRVADVQKAGRVKGTSRLGLELTELSLVDGQQLPIRSQLIEYSGGTSKGRDATAIGTTTGIGAAIGAAADGGFGAGIGAAAGAAASTIGVLLTRGRATEVHPEAVLTFRTLAPLTVSTLHSDERAFQPVGQQDYETRLQTRHVAPAPSYNPPIWYGGGWGGWGPGWYGPGYWGPGWGWGPRLHVYSGPRYYGRGYYGRGWGRGWRR